MKNFVKIRQINIKKILCVKIKLNKSFTFSPLIGCKLLLRVEPMIKQLK